MCSSRLNFPTGVIVVIKMEGPAFLCKTDEVGEICVLSGATGTGYYGLAGLTKNVFKVRPLDADGEPIGEEFYVRSGLLGFLGPGGEIIISHINHHLTGNNFPMRPCIQSCYRKV